MVFFSKGKTIYELRNQLSRRSFANILIVYGKKKKKSRTFIKHVTRILFLYSSEHRFMAIYATPRFFLKQIEKMGKQQILKNKLPICLSLQFV